MTSSSKVVDDKESAGAESDHDTHWDPLPMSRFSVFVSGTVLDGFKLDYWAA